MNIALEQAQKLIEAAKTKAKSIDTKMNIAVVDGGANLVAFVRMDDAWLGSVDIAIKKAKTARFFDMNSGEIGKLAQPGGSLYNIEHSNNESTPKSPILGKPDQIRTFDIFYPIEIQLITITRLILFKTIQHVL